MLRKIKFQNNFYNVSLKKRNQSCSGSSVYRKVPDWKLAPLPKMNPPQVFFKDST